MKKILLILLLVPSFLSAQKLIGGKNIIKTNLTSWVLNNYNITYERAFAKRFSFSLGFRYMPKTSMPDALKDILKKQFNDENINFSDFQMGNFAITPELRMYLGTGKLSGFYIAPYARYADFNLQVPVSYSYTPTGGSTINTSSIFRGNFTSLSGGLLLGTQFNLAKKIVFDIWIIGAHYGSSNGTITASFDNALSNEQATALNNQINDISGKEYGPFKFTGKGYDNNTKTATFTSTGAWAGLRAAGLSLGFRF